ncbi:MAG: galactokinase [Oscillospiraceae bacterium]|nr:galactokinase [Oscillospiraceae bacterium]
MNISDAQLVKLYGADALYKQKKRYENAAENFIEIFGKNDGVRIFSASGRTEISGNHTDHNCGKVLAAAVDLDVIAIVVPTDDGVITVKSEGFDIISVDTADLAVREDEKNTSAALIRGVAAGFNNSNLKIGGFKAYMTSNVLKGSGVSSSAAFEVLVGNILSGLYNGSAVSAVKIAQIAQYAENEYFGKPSGLLDQMASSVGGFVAIDFRNTTAPVIVPIEFDIAKYGYSLCIVDTKGSHADLTPEYAAIPEEMKAAAAVFGKTVLREVDEEEFRANISKVREKCGDRAVLRALHFFDENNRVDRAAEALKSGDIDSFLAVINESGNSSYKYLQNVFAATKSSEQGVSMGLYTAEKVLCGRGASRVHGGGFAGTIQAFVPDDILDEFIKAEEAIFGEGSCHRLYIRPVGGTEITY